MKNMRSRKKSVITFVCFSVLFFASAGAHAAPILYNTGVDNSGIVLDVGTPDPHYTMSGASNQAFRIKAYEGPPNWITLPANIVATAGWIGPEGSAPPVGEYTYTLEFDLGGNVEGASLNNFWISGSWASDNRSEIWLNGEDTGFETPEGEALSRLHDFTLNSGFVSGTNTLSFIVTNAGSPGSKNPTGLLVANLQAVPIPGAVWLLFSGMICLVCLRRRLRS